VLDPEPAEQRLRPLYVSPRAEPRHSPHVDPGEGMKKSKNIQEPQNHENDHDSIQDRLNGSCHWYEVIDQPEENPNHDQDQEYVK
jgi:hypothetical protein